MSRFRIALLSLLAVMAIGAADSASASADSCNGGTHFVFCTFPGNQPIHLGVVVGVSGLTVIAGRVGPFIIKIHCKDDVYAGIIHLLGLFLGIIILLECIVEAPVNCTTASLIEASTSTQVTSGTTGIATGNKGGGAAEELTSITLSGSSCSIAGTYALTGKQEVEFPEGEVGKVEHEIVAKKSGSKLDLGAEPASYSSTEKVHLESNGEWLIMKGE